MSCLPSSFPLYKFLANYYSMNAAQEENETTPTPSEHASPPAKKMKPHIVKKKGHLEPKSLPFSETKGTF